ncbi:MAG: DUF4238 domain-containing protein [Acidobacteriota bacterium]
MAGVKQHILPQFLLLGFASREDKGNSLIWVFRRGVRFESSISGFGFEKHFYGSEADEVNADPVITALEGPYSAIIKELRTLPGASNASNELVPEIVAHFSARTKHLRDSFVESSDELVSMVAERYKDSSVMHDFMRRYYLKRPEKLTEALDDALAQMNLPRWQRRITKRKVLGMGKQRLTDYVIKATPDIGLEIFTQFSQVRAALPSAVRASHIKTLAKDLARTPRVDEMKRMSWYVLGVNGLVLGDVACLFTSEKKPDYHTYAAKDEGITGIFLPISSDRLLVGTSASTPPIINVEEFNLAMTRKSRDYFVSSENSEQMINLQREIGSDSSLLSSDELREIALSDLPDEL